MQKVFTCLHLNVFLNGNRFALAILLSFLTFHQPVAFAQEDSCMAAIRWEPDGSDPMLIHFCFNGTTPPGSFSYNCTWDFGDGFTSTDSFTTHLYTQPGTYTICLDFNICIPWGLSCGDDTCIQVTVGPFAQMPEGIFDFKSIYSYPNPATSVLLIQANHHSENLVIQLLSTAGTEIRKLETKEAAAVLDVSTLADGIYFLKISDENNTVTRKVVIGE